MVPQRLWHSYHVFVSTAERHERTCVETIQSLCYPSGHTRILPTFSPKRSEAAEKFIRFAVAAVATKLKNFLPRVLLLRITPAIGESFFFFFLGKLLDFSLTGPRRSKKESCEILFSSCSLLRYASPLMLKVRARSKISSTEWVAFSLPTGARSFPANLLHSSSILNCCSSST